MRELFEGLDYLNRQRPIARHNTSACPPITGECEGAELKPRAALSAWHSRSKMRMVREAGKPPESGHQDPLNTCYCRWRDRKLHARSSSVAFVIGVANHFAIDAIAHVDYPLHSNFG
jgi:hypothetical protein